jgi:hypothetical protein
VAERDGKILGVLGVAVRTLLLPDGRERLVTYLGDLKIAPEARGGIVLRRLVQAAQQWLGPVSECAYSVVMDGTPQVPEDYTGRAGIPFFRELGKVVVLRLVCSTDIPVRAAPAGRKSPPHEATAAEKCFRSLSRGRYANLGGTPRERSEIEPEWLQFDHLACARLEDTRRTKRLIADDDTELRSAHLACFAFRDAPAGAALLTAACRRATALGFPALFASVAAADADAICAALAGIEIVRAPATIYGTGLESGDAWNIHTSEI